MTHRIRVLLVELGAELAAEGIRGSLSLWHRHDDTPEAREEILRWLQRCGGTRTMSAQIPTDDDLPAEVIDACEVSVGLLTVCASHERREATADDVPRVSEYSQPHLAAHLARGGVQ